MSESKSKRPGVKRREFVTGAAAAATLSALPWNARAQGVPMEFDGSKFQLAAPEPNPKSGGVLKYGITMRPPHFDFHQSGTINSLGSQGCMFDNLVRRDPRDSRQDHHPRPGAQLGDLEGRQDLHLPSAQGRAVP